MINTPLDPTRADLEFAFRASQIDRKANDVPPRDTRLICPWRFEYAEDDLLILDASGCLDAWLSTEFRYPPSLSCLTAAARTAARRLVMPTSTQPLTRDELQRLAPSVFSTSAHPRVSTQYQFISTLDLIDGLEQEGWFPVKASESRARTADRDGFTKHLLRFRRLDGRVPLVGDSFPEIVLLNSHDGSCAYQLHAGLFRLACSNGLIIASAAMGQMRRRHTGDALRDVIEGTDEIVDILPTIAGQVDRLQQVDLKPAEQAAFAEAALSLRWEADQAPVTPSQLLQARRPEDNGPTLWTTYQRVQENLLKGGLRYENRARRRTTTRAVTSVDGNVKLNQALWLLTERMAELKAA
ncbi:MAG TPA: DUF932 domain-containing protein [Candidatus Competibacteraceae bacterium]|nr:DUF932 domain-containing protein [Candidatus Competibacteraceae bacterium]